MSSQPTHVNRALFTFVDLKDPFVQGEVADEVLPGPVLSILSAKPFDELFLFHTPHTLSQTEATRIAVADRFPSCRVTIQQLPAANPKDYSVLMGSLSRFLRDRYSSLSCNDNFVCVSSGTAEMRASWFLLNALGILPATLLQVGSPAYPLFGPANVKEVPLDSKSWQTLRHLAMPWTYFLNTAHDSLSRSLSTASLPPDQRKIRLGLPRSKTPASATPKDQLPPQPAEELSQESRPPDLGTVFDIDSENSPANSPHSARVLNEPVVCQDVPLPPLDDALLELNLHVGSAHLRYAAEQAAIAAESSLPILLTGETGTGKERFAHLIHRLSPRASKYIVPVNCAAIPESLAETYLFGHTKGAFSGATADKPGLFENADGSTLFLDEIAELSLDIQAKLLRVIQDGVIQRIGSPRSRQVDVRIVAATNRDLKKEVQDKRFREDLYFRLEVVQIRLPALRDRRAEIPQLALSLLKQINQRRQRPRQLSKDALRALEDYPWPGNVRQLSNVLERSVLYSRSDVLEPAALLFQDGSNHHQPLAFLPEPAPGFSIEDFLADARKHLFLLALKRCNNNQVEAAALLGVSKQAVSKFVASLDDNRD